jgi:ANTAR domain
MMETERDQTTGAGGPRRRSREQSRGDDLPGRTGGYRGRHSQTVEAPGAPRTAVGPGPYGGPDPAVGTRSDGGPGMGSRRDDGRSTGSRHDDGRSTGSRHDDGRSTGSRHDDGGLYRPDEPPVARRTATGWRVGNEEVSDLTSAMVLADLLAADLPAEGPPTPGSPAASAASRRPGEAEPPDVRQLQETVAQLEHALTVRVRVEQAIGVLAERHRLRPRLAFELLRSAARARGRRVLEVAGEVVDSATNPLLRLPEELAKPPVARRRGRMPRRPQESD